MLDLLLAGSATALATGLGVIPVHLLRDRAHTFDALLTGVAAGVMTVASLLGLLKPALESGSAAAVGVGALLGAGLVIMTRRLLIAHELRAGVPRRPGMRASILTFAVLFAHSLPEGFAIGTAYASKTAGLGLFVILAIGIQNVPEGTAVAIPMQQAGFSFGRQFWAAVGTSVPQPIGAVVAYFAVEQVNSLLPVSFGFAAGAMLLLVAVELVPGALAQGHRRLGIGGIATGAGVMGLLSLALGV
jgi:zinc transporter, ZIP family